MMIKEKLIEKGAQMKMIHVKLILIQEMMIQDQRKKVMEKTLETTDPDQADDQMVPEGRSNSS